jgi:lysophospholipase L1-like esterase
VVAVRVWTSWVAVGDSFTEGLNDEGPDGGYVGWADRLAATLAVRNPEFRYANLALRGKLLKEIVEEQVSVALQVKPDLVTLCAGGNDLIAPSIDDAFASATERAAVSGCSGRPSPGSRIRERNEKPSAASITASTSRVTPAKVGNGGSCP